MFAMDDVAVQAEAGFVAEQNAEINALAFNPAGNCLAVGDSDGKVSIFSTDELFGGSNERRWMSHVQYQAYDNELDFLKSAEVEARIKQLHFCRHTGKNQFLLSSNDKVIKLWKIGYRMKYTPSAISSVQSGGKLELPKRTGKSNSCSSSTSRMNFSSFVSSSSERISIGEGSTSDESSQVDNEIDDYVSIFHPSLSRTYFKHAHSYFINSLSSNSDGETFISADDLRICWWNTEVSDTSFNVVDIKPDDMSHLNEVITTAMMHPIHCNLLGYSTSRGSVRICDTRVAATCQRFAQVFSDYYQANHGPKSLVSDILKSLSHFTYSTDGKYIITRDFMTVKVWDVAMEAKPVSSVLLHEHLRPHLFEMYTNDTIYDKFEVCCSPDGRTVATGSYNNQLKVFRHDHNNNNNSSSSSSSSSAGCPYPKIVTVNLPTESNLQAGRMPLDCSRHFVPGRGFSVLPVHLSRVKANLLSATGVALSAVESGTARLALAGSELDGLVSSNGRAMPTRKKYTPGDEIATPVPPKTIHVDEHVLHSAWSPTDNVVAMSTKAGLVLCKIAH